MRRPTPLMELLRWHRQALGNPNHPRIDGDPQCGWYRMRSRGGHFVPVEIYCTRDIDESGELTAPERIVAEVFMEPSDANKIWLFLEPISRAEFHRLTEYLLANQDINLAARVDLGAKPTLPRR